MLARSSAHFRRKFGSILQFAASRKNGYLLGSWDCTWDTLVPAARPQIRDTVNITSVHGNLVKGHGSTPGFGDWDIDGRVSPLAVSFSYSGRAKKQNLPGAIVLKIAKNDEMLGTEKDCRFSQHQLPEPRRAQQSRLAFGGARGVILRLQKSLLPIRWLDTLLRETPNQPPRGADQRLRRESPRRETAVHVQKDRLASRR